MSAKDNTRQNVSVLPYLLEISENQTASLSSPLLESKKSKINTEPTTHPSEGDSRGAAGLISSLLEEEFTFDAIIASLDAEEVHKKTLVRVIWDTGCKAFLISQEAVTRSRVSQSAIKPVKEPTVLKGLGGSAHTPEFQVKLTWHMPKQMASREDVFFIIPKAPFDILAPSSLIGSRHAPRTDSSEVTALTLIMDRVDQGKLFPFLLCL